MSAPQRLEVEVIRCLSAADALAPAWRDLAGRAVSRSITRTPRWMLTWWRVFGAQAGRALRIVSCRTPSGELVGLVPLLRRVAWVHGALPVRRLELLATGEDEAEEICSDYVGALAAPGYDQAVAGAFTEALASGALGGWDELALVAMSGEDPLVSALEQALASRRLAPTIRVTGESRFIPLPATWADYLKALGSARRYLVTRALRELERWAGPGGYRLVRAGEEGSLDEGYRVLLALHRERWSFAGAAGGEQGEGGVAVGGVFDDRRFARFHELLLPKLHADRREGSVVLDWLVARGRPIAASYAHEYQGVLQFYQSGRALELPPQVRPGIALHALSIRRAIEAGAREYDFLTGDSQYKKQLALAARPLVSLHAWGPGARGASLSHLGAAIERARPRLRLARDAARALRQRFTR